jgi:spore coat protein H
MRKLLISLIAISIVLTGCTLPSSPLTKEPEPPQEGENRNVDVMREDKKIYLSDDPNTLVHFYVTILPQEVPDSPTFDQLNRWYLTHSNTGDSPILNVIIQEGDENGPDENSLGYSKNLSNADFSIRGQSSRLEVQKSYKIKLHDRAGLWNGQKTINLNKHIDDRSRVKNKLTFDYVQKIPELPSLRTQFVQLHIRDLSSSSNNADFQSYGLYTHVEQVNERYLSSHGLNPYGHLYKVINFEFRIDETKMKTVDDPDFDIDQFETMLESKGNNDHSKLISMLQDLNDPNYNINEIVERYFDRENLLSWLAINLLFGNIDTEVNNYYLYSAPSSEKWYFIPWDYDKAWGWHTDEDRGLPSWQTGLARYWNNKLFQRFLKDSNNVKQLNDKIEELSSTIITNKQTETFLNGYKSVVKPLVSQVPDKTYYPVNINQFEDFYHKLVLEPEYNKAVYYEQLEYPMPIFLGDPVKVNQSYQFHWDQSYDIQGDDLFYTFQLAKDIEFKNIILEQKGLIEPNTSAAITEKGRYFWRVLISDTKGHQQIPFDYYIFDDSYYWGLRELIIQ